MKEIRTDLYTQVAYAKKIDKTPARVNQLVKKGLLDTVQVNGGVLIKSS